MLPKLDVPIFETKLISNNQVIRFRPFLVKEQKLFLMSNETNDTGEMVKTVKQVLKNCVLDEIDVDNLATFDLEYLFLNLRARSVSDVSNLKFTCNNTVKGKAEDGNDEEKKCGNTVEINVNLLEVECIKNPEHVNKIELTDKVGIIMKYPTFSSINIDDLNSEDIEKIVEVIIGCIDYIYDENQVYYAKDTPEKELIEFVENLKQSDLEKVSKFFNTLPKIKKDLDFDCKKCGYKETITLEGMQSFFA
jgi:hypothetical protein